jgi:hypothetical protein
MNSLKLDFEATECNGWPKLRFFIDNDLYQDFEFTKKFDTIELPLDMLDGIHALEIELYGKTYKNTILDNNKIIDDQSVTLKNIWIDNVQILDFVKYKGIYHVKNEMLPQTLTWKQNGSWKLHFEYPINKWIQETQPSIYSNT